VLIAMAVYDTEENDRTWMTKETLKSLAATVDFGRHRLVISDNASCDETLALYEFHRNIITGIYYNEGNIGTAKAINRAWTRRWPGEHCVKLDNDVMIHQAEWADWMEDAFERDPELGILGLKRRDLDENPFDGSSTLRMLPHEKGQRWIVIEEVEHVIGTCQAYSSALLDRIGYLVQPGVYGFDDSLSSVRAHVAGFKRAFLCGFEIDHIDPGGSPFNEWKITQANADFDAYKMMASEYEMAIKDVYYDGL
jgi:GT2 family glycosyltransferase